MQASNPFLKEDLLIFYKQGLPEILKKVFLQPANGLYTLFFNLSEKAFVNALILFGSAFVLYTLVPYLLAGSAGRQYMGFSTFLQMGLSILIFLFLVSLASFGLKAIKGKPSFKMELFTGGLCAVPLLALLAVAVLAKLFAGGDNVFAGIFGLVNIFNVSSGPGLFFMLPALLCFLLLINVLFQSLKAGGLKDTAAWYLSPISIVICFYLTFKIMDVIF